MVAAEQAKETSSIQTLTLRVLPICIHSQLRMLREPKTNTNTVMWTRVTLETPFWTKLSTTTWRDRSTKNKNFVSEIRWTEMLTNPWWVRTCSTASRERRQWSLWDLTGKPTWKIRTFLKEQAESSNENHNEKEQVYNAVHDLNDEQKLTSSYTSINKVINFSLNILVSLLWFCSIDISQ